MNDAYKDYGWHEGAVWSHQYLTPVVEAMLVGEQRRTILDLGCGNGALACRLLGQGFDVYGSDASESGIAVANASHPRHFFVQNIDSGALPDALAAIPFDTVISTEVIEHLYAPRAYMALVRSVLKKRGGELILSTPYHGYLKNLALAAAGRMDDHFTALWDGGHIKFWSRRTLTALLGEFGFEVREFRGAGRAPWLWKSMVVRAVIGAGGE